MRVASAQHRPLPLQDVGVQMAGLAEAALGAQHVGDWDCRRSVCWRSDPSWFFHSFSSRLARLRLASNSPTFHW